MLSKSIIGAGGTLGGGAFSFDGDVTAIPSAATRSYALQTTVYRIWGIYFSDDGTRLYVTDNYNPFGIEQYSLSTPWNISTASFVRTTATPSNLNLNQVIFKPDGTKIYATDRGNDYIREYSVTTAWNLSSGLSAGGSYYSAPQDDRPRNITINPDGTKLILFGNKNNRAYEYTMSTPWSLSTISYTGRSMQFYAAGSLESSLRGGYVSADGLKIYGIGQTYDGPIQYNLSTPWNLSTATYAGYKLLQNPALSAPQTCFWSYNGTSFYTGNEASTTLYQWDI